MKAKILVLTFLLLGSINAFPFNTKCNKQGDSDCSEPNFSRTFSPKKSIKHDGNINFKSALFSITKSSIVSKANVPFYRIHIDGNIDIAPGGNKFWDLESKATIVDLIDRQIEPEAKDNANFKDGTFYKTVFLSVLGQNIKANEYYTISDDGLSAKRMTIVTQSVISSGITVIVPTQEVLFNPSKPVCYFPLAYDGITHTVPQYNCTINAKVSGASALGIPDGTNVSYSITFDDNYKVLSWGGLQLIDNEKPVNALLVQSESKTVGSVFINGTKAPQSVLSPLKMKQDSASVSVSYSFRNRTYPDNIVEFGLEGNKVTYLSTIKTVKN